MNLTHLRAFVWLRYRLLVNQLARGGIANQIVLAFVALTIVVSVIVLTATSFLAGWLGTGDVSPIVVMLIADGVVLVFFFAWCIGVLSELQRSEALSIERFLHLPVSVAGVFGLNYCSSLFSVNLLLVAPVMFGFTAGLTLSRGPALLVVFPLIVTHLLTVTALTYQFQGWLASLMIDQRRRRTVIMAVTLVFVLVCQLPSLIGVFRPWENTPNDGGGGERFAAEQLKNKLALDQGEITPEEFQQRHSKILAEHRSEAIGSNQRIMEQVDVYATLLNTIIPLGWLPLGVRSTLDGNVLPALYGTLGYTIISGVSLWRAYGTTLRIYTGQIGGNGVTTTQIKVATVPSRTLLERRLPWFSEQATVIALAGFRSLTRAPEAKMLLLTPLMVIVVLAGMYFRITDEVPEYARPLMAVSGTLLILITLTQWVGNQFGFDRAGFRSFVLSPVPRREILLGKNLAVAPIALSLIIVTICVINVLFPMRIDHFLALFPQLLSMFLLFCMLANFLSIYAPMPIAAGTAKPASTKLIPVLLHMLFMGAFGLILAPTMVPLGIEAGLDALGWVQGVPICLPLAMLLCAGVIVLYRFALGWQGELLQAREQTILETVTTKQE